MTLSRESIGLQILESLISDPVLAIDRSQKIVFGNQALWKHFGKGTTLSELFRVPEVLDTFKSAIEKKTPIQSDPILIPTLATPSLASEEKQYFQCFAIPFEPLGAIGLLREVTRYVQTEKMRIDFVANVSHELRTPLTSIKSYIDTMEMDVKSGKPVPLDFLKIVRNNSDRLISLVQDLLDLSSLESNDFTKEPLSKWEVDTDSITQRVLSQWAKNSKAVTIETNFSARTVLADELRTEQVLTNLLSNAIKYTPQGGKITISWENDSTSTILKISDTGPGISHAHQARIFERFYRVDKARSRELGGTGLGLAIVKHIMMRHGGSAEVSSEPPHGTTFICKFPR